MSNKHLLTKIVFDSLPLSNPWQNKSLDRCISEWWITKRSNSCYRLSDSGKYAFEIADIQGYNFSMPLEKEDYAIIITKGLLSKKIKCPYYLGFKTQRYESAYITVYDSKVAMLITLYGTVHEFLNLKNEITN